MAVESHGFPVGVALDGANRNYIKLLKETLLSIIIPRREGAHLCLDAGYAGAQELARELGDEPHKRSRGEEKVDRKRTLILKRGGGW